jgi:hypothetical protein
MPDNPLLKNAKPVFETRMTAMDWARLAREKGLLKHESAWLAEAKRRGEIPSYGDRDG